MWQVDDYHYVPQARQNYAGAEIMSKEEKAPELREARKG